MPYLATKDSFKDSHTPKIKSKYSRIFSTWHGKAVCAVVVTVVGSDAGVPETDVQGGFAGGGERQ